MEFASFAESQLPADWPSLDRPYEAEPSMAETDLRKDAQDHKRFAAHKHKWALGAFEPRGRPGNPRPNRPVETYHSYVRRSEIQRLVHKTAKIRKHHAPELNYTPAIDDLILASDLSDDMDDGAGEIPADAGVMYSFDAVRSPGDRSHVFNGALARAVERFEEREMLRLVEAEYDVLDSEGESVMLARSKGKAAPAPRVSPHEDEDDEYEFV